MGFLVLGMKDCHFAEASLVCGGADISPLFSEIAVEDLSAGTVLVTEAELSSCVEDVFKVECLLWCVRR